MNQFYSIYSITFMKKLLKGGAATPLTPRLDPPLRHYIIIATIANNMSCLPCEQSLSVYFLWLKTSARRPTYKRTAQLVLSLI